MERRQRPKWIDGVSDVYTIELEVRRPPLPPGTATTPYELVAYLVAPTVAISKRYKARLSEDSSWPARPEARLCLRQVFGSPTDWAPQLPILPEVTSLGSIGGTSPRGPSLCECFTFTRDHSSRSGTQHSCWTRRFSNVTISHSSS